MKTLSRTPRSILRAVGLASGLALAAAMLTACAGKNAAADPQTPLNTGLDSLAQHRLAQAEAQQAALAELAERSAVDLERILAAQQQVEAAKAVQARPPAPVASAPLIDPNTAVVMAAPAASAPAPVPTAPDAGDPDVQAAAAANGLDPAVLAAALAAAQQIQQTPSPQRSPQEKIPQLASDLGTLIRQRADAAPAPLTDYLVLAALESVQPSLLGENGKLSSKITSKLSSSELQLLTAFRTLIGSVAPAGLDAGDPVATASRLADAFPSVAAVLPLRVADARLCTRVMGFGAYVPFERSIFQAGRPQPAIVYVEVDRFSHRPAKSSDPGVSDVPTFNTPDMWAVELSQELNLHQDSDGSLQWRQAPQVVIETSRRPRRDFYLIQQIELPPTLTVGNYTLKITIRDRVNDAVAEAVLPIQIVADPALAAGQ